MLDVKLTKLPMHLKIAVNGAFKARQAMSVVGDILKAQIRNGGDYDEAVSVLSEIKSIKDFPRVFESLGMKWEEVALMTPDSEKARELYLRSAIYYAIAAEFPFIESMEERKKLYERYMTCYLDALRAYSDWDWERIEIPFGEHIIPAILTKKKDIEKPPVVILLHGLWGSKESNHWIAELLVNNGFAVLRIDLPGHGESKYPFTPDVENTIKATIDYIYSRNDLNSERICVAGISLGGHTALKSGDDERISTIIDIAGFYGISSEEAKKINAILKRMMLAVTGMSEKEFMKSSEKMTLSGVIKKIKCPVLIIHGEKDNTVPVIQAQKIYDELECEKQIHIIPDAGHTFIGKMDEVAKLAIDWLKEKL